MHNATGFHIQIETYALKIKTVESSIGELKQYGKKSSPVLWCFDLIEYDFMEWHKNASFPSVKRVL